MRLRINGREEEVDAPPEMPLLWVIRDRLGLTGTKYGCGVGLCGACTVHLDGEPVRSCSVRAGDVGAREITTIEGASGPVAEAVRSAWSEADVIQCGYCQPGQIMSAIALLDRDPRPSPSETERVMNGVLCRCGTYLRILDAVRRASEEL